MGEKLKRGARINNKGGVKMKRGFTLIELIVVIAIIAVLAAIIAPAAFKQVEKSKVVGTVGDYKSIKTAVMAYYSDTGVWPTSAFAVAGACFTANPGAPVTNWDGPYLEKWPTAGRWSGAAVAGTVTYLNDAAGFTPSWDAVAGADNARYIRISQVPLASARALDRQIDGTNAGAETDSRGYVRYSIVAGDPIPVDILISTDVVPQM